MNFYTLYKYGLIELINKVSQQYAVYQKLYYQ